MARHRIFDKEGNRTKFFWSDKDGRDRKHRTVYKEAGESIKRMKGVHYDVDRKKFCKE